MGRGVPGEAVGLHKRNRNKARVQFESNVALPSSELSLTFVQRRRGHKPYPKRKLGKSNSRKPSRYANAFPGYGVYPVTTFSCISSESLNNRRNST